MSENSTKMIFSSLKSKKAKKAKKDKKDKKKSVNSLKKEAWKLFSIFIRTRGMDEDGFNVCVTCGTRMYWRLLQCGHFIPGRHNSVLFDENNCHSQCAHCNIFLHGNLIKYYRFMLKKYGEKEIERLEKEDRKSVQFKPKDLEKIIKLYKQKTAHVI